MVLNFEKFLNEETLSPEQIKEGDRIICYGSIEKHDENGNSFHLDIDGQTGIVAFVNRGYYNLCGIVFDNYFSNALNDLDRRININRCSWVITNKLKKIPIVKENKNILKFSKNFKKIIDYVEYVECPIYIEDINYIDITSRQDTISYISNERLKRLNVWKDDEETLEKIYSSTLRQEMKISRFIQMINPNTNKFSMDKKIDLYKSAYKSVILNKYNFKIVSGEDIRYWYDYRNYYGGVGSLNRSCMRNSMDRLNIYCENEDKINMLIMTDDDNNKLLGRALIWKVDKPKCIYLDRPYTVFQEDILAFYDFAIKRRWKYYDTPDFENMIIYLKKDYGDPERNPYMDTFSVFCIDGVQGNNYLTNSTEGCENYYIYNEA